MGAGALVVRREERANVGDRVERAVTVTVSETFQAAVGGTCTVTSMFTEAQEATTAVSVDNAVGQSLPWKVRA